ncbi:MAG: acyltransferase family protein [Verrucomicrobiota bacterium]
MTTSLSYRPDIDGLRGIAVLLVLLFHCSVPLLPGGYIGVDVFFVISGYLISTILFTDLRAQRFCIALFYQRRIRRIFPALIIVLAATYVFGWVVLFPSEFENLGKHAVGCSLFISNLLLWRETGYFTESAELKPLLHLWSLGVEEQFYLGFPLALWFISRYGWATTRFLGATFILSFALCLYSTLKNPGAAFFLPFTRIWEILAGCLLASLEQDEKSNAKGRAGALFTKCKTSPTMADACSVSGLILISLSAFVIHQGRAFPGAWALLPVTGTVLLIFAGQQARLNRWLLGHKVLVGLGLISYPLYLWHWPLLYFARVISQDDPSAQLKLSLMVLSVILAVFTFRFIERPFRFGSLPAMTSCWRLGTAMTMILLLGFLAYAQKIPSRLGANPEFAAAIQHWYYPFTDNADRYPDFKLDTHLNPHAPGGTVLFIGDSHLQHFWPRIEAVLHDAPERTRPVSLITAPGRPALPNVRNVKSGCPADELFAYALLEAARTNVTTVVFSCFWEKYFIGWHPGREVSGLYRANDPARKVIQLGTPAADRVFAEFGQSIAKLVEAGKEVVVILPTPASTLLDPRSTPRMPFSQKEVTRLALKRSDFESFIHPVKQILNTVVTANGGRTIDPLVYFDENGYFFGQTSDGRFLYQDKHHLRPFYAKEQATFIDALIINP